MYLCSFIEKLNMIKVQNKLTLFFTLVFSTMLLVNNADAQSANGQVGNVITTAVPTIRITPDARSGGMAELGVATSPDVNAVYHNAGKLVFNDKEVGIGLSFVPWFRGLGVTDVYLANLSGHYKLDKNQALGLQVHYMSFGNIDFTDAQGNATGQGRPREFSIGLGYSRKLSDNLGAGINLKYINSDLASGQILDGTQISKGNAVAADIGFYGKNKLGGNLISYGAAISNIGSKVSYNKDKSDKDFLPCNLGLGANYTYNVDDYNKVSFGLELNKLLVPTPNYGTDSASILDNIERRAKSPISGIFSSFGDAPGGMSEEMKEFTVSAGAEYWYDNQFAVRAGYFNEARTKGNRKYLTLGLGVKYSVFTFNFAYLVATNGKQSPLNNTMRFSLLFDFSAFEDQESEKSNF